MPFDPPIELNLPEGGALRLRHLTVGDSRKLDKWVFDGLPARDLALRLLEQQLESAPEEFQAASLPDQALVELLHQWMSRSLPDEWTGERPSDLDALKRQLRGYCERERKEAAEMAARLIGADTIKAVTDQYRVAIQALAPLQSSIAALQQHLLPAQEMARQLSSITRAFEPMQGFTRLLADSFTIPQIALPDLSAFQRSFADSIPGVSPDLLLRIKVRAAATETLGFHGMRFASGIVPFVVATRLNELKNPKDARAVLRQLGSWLRGQRFRGQLFGALEAHPRSRRRLPLISDALDAHVTRTYSLSVPVFTAQAEGILTDFLVRKGLVRRRGSKVYAVDRATGAIRVDTKGKEVQLSGWSTKLGVAKTTEHEIIEDLAAELVGAFIPQRNAMLHGHELRYAVHQRSAYALLVLACAAITLAEEAGESQPTLGMD